MAKLFKRGPYYWYDFRFQNTRYQGSTFLKNKEKAESFVAAFRTNLAHGLVGITHKDPPPILSVFLKGPFLDWVRQNAKKPRTQKFYEEQAAHVSAYPPSKLTRLDGVDELFVQGYKDFELAKKLSRATINGRLRTLKKAMIYADACKLIRYQRFKTLPGENERMFILDGETELRYLALADYPLKQVAILMLDLGLRPEEAVSLRKADIAAQTVEVREGKTVNARRSLPQTERTVKVFALCNALFPKSEWVFPGSKGQHFTRGAISNLHTKLRDEHEFPDEFLLYSCRHTFGTRLAEATGGDIFAIKEAMGHSSVKVSEKYVHPTPKYIGLAFKRKEDLDKMIRGETEEVPTIFTTAPKK